MPSFPLLNHLLPSLAGKPAGAQRASLQKEAGEGSGKEAQRTSPVGPNIARNEPRENPSSSQQSAAHGMHKRLEEMKAAINQELERLDVGLKFQMNQEADRVVVKVVNRQSGEVIRQIPPEEMLELAQNLKEMSGLLVNTRS